MKAAAGAAAVLLLGAGLAAASAALQLLAGGSAAGQPMKCLGYSLSQGYGPVTLGLEPPLFGYPHFHSGWDLVCPAGTDVSAVLAGEATVEFDSAGFGISVVVAAGELYVRYAHLALALVNSGDTVFAGQALGAEGSTGNSTGAHLHFEVDRGCPLPRCAVDPAALVSPP